MPATVVSRTHTVIVNGRPRVLTSPQPLNFMDWNRRERELRALQLPKSQEPIRQMSKVG
jgi:hypothetical protein